MCKFGPQMCLRRQMHTPISRLTWSTSLLLISMNKYPKNSSNTRFRLFSICTDVYALSNWHIIIRCEATSGLKIWMSTFASRSLRESLLSSSISPRSIACLLILARIASLKFW
uniref:(northern house mosquito) hypothetical protein n=1 Tax=Culex pipiens TaxID=7175 RepID=A0A8D8K6Z1_CULPI